MDSHLLEFESSEVRSGPLTWAQSEIRAIINATPPADRHVFNLSVTVPIPSGLSMSSIFDTVRVVIERHASLRTSFVDLGCSGKAQMTPASGEIRVNKPELADVPSWNAVRVGDSPPAEAVVELCTQVCGSERHAEARPVEVSVLGRSGEPAYLVLCLSHLIADGWGARLLRRDLVRLLDLGERETETEVVQPLDMAATECSAAGQRRNSSAIEHWRRCLDAVEETDVHRPINKLAGRGFPRVCVDSTALRAALPHAARRYGVSTTTVLCAAVAYVAAAMTGEDVFLFDVPTPNRVSDRLRRSVGMYSQHAFAAWRVAGHDFGDTARGIHAANLVALRHGHYDPLSMRRAFSSWPGFDDLAYSDYMINDMRFTGPSTGLPQEHWNPAEALAESRIAELPGAPESGRFWFWVAETEQFTRLTFGSRPEFVSAAGMEKVLRQLEGLCVAQALGEPYHLDGFGSVN